MMLEHLYGTVYEEWDEIDSFRTTEFQLSMFVLGNKYDIDSLRSQAAGRFCNYLQHELRDCSLNGHSIYAIQKLLGPNALQLADRSLTRDTQEYVLDKFPRFCSTNCFAVCLPRE